MLHQETWFARSKEAQINGEMLVRTFPQPLRELIAGTSPLTIYGYLDAYGKEVYDITGVYERNLYTAKEVEIFFVRIEKEMGEKE